MELELGGTELEGIPVLNGMTVKESTCCVAVAEVGMVVVEV